MNDHAPAVRPTDKILRIMLSRSPTSPAQNGALVIGEWLLKLPPSQRPGVEAMALLLEGGLDRWGDPLRATCDAGPLARRMKDLVTALVAQRPSVIFSDAEDVSGGALPDMWLRDVASALRGAWREAEEIANQPRRFELYPIVRPVMDLDDDKEISIFTIENPVEYILEEKRDDVALLRRLEHHQSDSVHGDAVRMIAKRLLRVPDHLRPTIVHLASVFDGGVPAVRLYLQGLEKRAFFEQGARSVSLLLTDALRLAPAFDEAGDAEAIIASRGAEIDAWLMGLADALRDAERSAEPSGRTWFAKTKLTMGADPWSPNLSPYRPGRMLVLPEPHARDDESARRGAEIMTDWLASLPVDDRPPLEDLAFIVHAGTAALRLLLDSARTEHFGDPSLLRLGVAVLRLLQESPAFDGHASMDELLSEDAEQIDPWLREVAAAIRTNPGPDPVQAAKDEATVLQTKARARGERLGRNAALDLVAVRRGEGTWHALRPKLEAQRAAGRETGHEPSHGRPGA